MARYHNRFECAHEGCRDWVIFDADTRKEQADQQRRYSRTWLCMRHSQPDQVLGVSNRVRVYECASDERPHGVYWGHFGFVSGPGFRAYAKDFPPGTVLRVTAEAILPTNAAEGVERGNGNG